MSKDIIKFNEILESYVYLKECCAINNERAELDLDLDIYDLEDYYDSLISIVKKYSISVFKIANDYDIDELNEYIIYLENKLVNELHYRLTFMYRYDK